MTSSWIEVLPPAFQSGNIGFSQWISLITLGTAPMIAHVISGAPEYVYLSPTRPRWHDRMCLYCPLTILWRYMAIADRRIRARNWAPSDVAAANAIFWTDNGWDGSEEIADLSASYSVRLSKRAHLTLLSWDSVKTIITTLQGVQLQVITSIPHITGPIAVMGLWRLCAAFWITSDFSYTSIPERAESSEPATRKRAPSIDSLLLPHSWSLPASAEPEHHISKERFKPTPPASVIFRTLYIAFFSVVAITGAPLWLVPLPGRFLSALSTTSMLGIFMTAYTGVTALLLYGYYASRYGCWTTVIPCVNSLWYKTFCGMYFVFWVVLFSFSAIETSRTPCGTYTTGRPGPVDDAWGCPGLLYVSPSQTAEHFGLLGNDSQGKGGYLKVDKFVGTCQGVIGKSGLVQLSSNSSVVFGRDEMRASPQGIS